MPTPTVPDPIPDEDYNDFLEWTREEEEAFMDIVNKEIEKNLPKDE